MDRSSKVIDLKETANYVIDSITAAFSSKSSLIGLGAAFLLTFVFAVLRNLR